MAGASNPRWARAGRVSVGQQFGSWTVLSAEPFEKSGALYVRDIDRRNNDGHYEPGNLRLVTRKVNLANRSRRATTS